MILLLKHAVRRLVKAPGFALAAALMLGLGIAMSTLAFTTTNGVVLRPLPFSNAEQLVRVSTVSPQAFVPMLAPGNAIELCEQLNDIGEFGLFLQQQENVAEPGQPPVQRTGLSVSANVLSLLRVQPMLGRGFRPGEDQPNQPGVMLLTHRFWREHFGSDPGVLGKVLRVQTSHLTIVGILPPAFDEALLWKDCRYVTLMTVWPNWRAERGAKWMSVMGRLRPEASLGTAQVRLEALARQLARDYPTEMADDTFRAEPLGASVVTPHVRMTYWLVVALALLVLVIACANLSAVQLARAIGRENEFAVRCALGATRRDLIATLAAESLIIAAVGTGLGLLLTYGTAGVFSHWIVGAVLPVDARVIGFGLLAGLCATLCFALAPVWLITRRSRWHVDTAPRRSTSDPAQNRLKHALIVGQLGVALALVSTAASLTLGVRAFVRRERGWRPEGLVTCAFQPPTAWIEKERQEPRLAQLLEAKLRAIPGVQRVGITSDVWLYGDATVESLMTEGGEPAPAGREPRAFVASVNTAFFATIGLTLREGRLFPADWRRGDPPVAVVSAATARRLWPNGTALGKRIRIGQESAWREVIGIVCEATFAIGYGTPAATLQIYRPVQDAPNLWYGAVLQTRQRALTLEKPLRAAFHDLAPDFMVVQIGDLPGMLESFASLGPLNSLLVVFAASGLLIALIGLYGVMSQFAQQRRHEIGVRIALGAETGDVIRLILARAARLLILGAGLGVVCAYAVALSFRQALPEFPLFGVAGHALVACALVVGGLVACYLPSARAARIDPADVLRAE